MRRRDFLKDAAVAGLALRFGAPALAGQKASVGPLTAARIGLPRLRAACPHFGDWLARLEALAARLR